MANGADNQWLAACFPASARPKLQHPLAALPSPTCIEPLSPGEIDALDVEFVPTSIVMLSLIPD